LFHHKKAAVCAPAPVACAAAPVAVFAAPVAVVVASPQASAQH
jgi:hypothetical protein